MFENNNFSFTFLQSRTVYKVSKISSILQLGSIRRMQILNFFLPIIREILLSCLPKLFLRRKAIHENSKYKLVANICSVIIIILLFISNQFTWSIAQFEKN